MNSVPILNSPASEHGLLPWHARPWQAVMTRLHAGRLPHALLLSGMSGLGKERFAEALVQALLCSQPHAEGQGCGQCRSCLLYSANTHPDFLRIAPPEPGKAIPIDTLREMNNTLQLKSQYAGYKLVIISPADRMNQNAANCLLKTLEEPPAQSLLILVTSQPAALPATVRSRCQQIKFSPPDTRLAADWLAGHSDAKQDSAGLLNLSGGTPLQALALLKSDSLDRRIALLEGFENVIRQKTDPVALAALWMQHDVAEVLRWLTGLLTDMIKLSYTREPAALNNPDLRARLMVLNEKLDMKALYAGIDQLVEAQHALQRQANVQLLLEDMLVFCFNLSNTK